MQRIIPLDVVEYIIDFCGSRNPAQDPTVYPRFLACSLVQKSWLPRSRYNLFLHVVLRTPAKIIHFMETIAKRPQLKTRVVELTIAPRRPCYMPFNALFHQIHGIYTLNISLDWTTYPLRYARLMMGSKLGFSDVQVLQIRGTIFPDLGELVWLITALPDLRTLKLSSVEFKRKPTEHESKILHCGVAKRLPRNLNAIVIEETSAPLLILRTLGCSVLPQSLQFLPCPIMRLSPYDVALAGAGFQFKCGAKDVYLDVSYVRVIYDTPGVLPSACPHARVSLSQHVLCIYGHPGDLRVGSGPDSSLWKKSELLQACSEGSGPSTSDVAMDVDADVDAVSNYTTQPEPYPPPEHERTYASLVYTQRPPCSETTPLSNAASSSSTPVRTRGVQTAQPVQSTSEGDGHQVRSVSPPQSEYEVRPPGPHLGPHSRLPVRVLVVYLRPPTPHEDMMMPCSLLDSGGSIAEMPCGRHAEGPACCRRRASANILKSTMNAKRQRQGMVGGTKGHTVNRQHRPGAMVVLSCPASLPVCRSKRKTSEVMRSTVERSEKTRYERKHTVSSRSNCFGPRNTRVRGLLVRFFSVSKKSFIMCREFHL